MRIEIGNYCGKPVFFDRKQALNGHMVILGGTGGGKTTEEIKVMVGMAKQNVTILAFDTNNIFSDSQIHSAYLNEFKKYLHEVDAYSEGICVPLFTPLTFSDGEKEKIVDTIDTVTEAFSNTFKFGVKQKSILRTAVGAVVRNDLYKSNGIEALATMLDEIGTAEAAYVKDRISQITEHNIFVDGELFIQPGKINLVRISKFSDDTQRKVMEILSAFLWKYATKEKFKQNGLYMVFDECQNMDLGKRGMIGKILVEGRRFNLNLILSTQVLSQEAHIKKLMTQAALILNFKPALSELRTVAKLIGGSSEDSWVVILKRLKRGEFIASGAVVYEDNLLTDPLMVSARLEETTAGTDGSKSNIRVTGLE